MTWHTYVRGVCLEPCSQETCNQLFFHQRMRGHFPCLFCSSKCCPVLPYSHTIFFKSCKHFFPNKKLPESCSEQYHSPQLLTLKIFLLGVCSTCPNPWNYFLIHAECCLTIKSGDLALLPILLSLHLLHVITMIPVFTSRFIYTVVIMQIFIHWRTRSDVYTLLTSPLSLNFPFVFISF